MNRLSLPALTLLALLFNSFALSAEPVRTVVIDPGHGGDSNTGDKGKDTRTFSSKNNAWTASGHAIKDISKRRADTAEKFLTLQLSQMIKDHINKKGVAIGMNALLTRSGDTNPTMAERAKVASDAKAASFVSIHFNATPSAHRTEAVVRAAGALRPNPNHARDSRFARMLVDATSGALAPYLKSEGLAPITKLVDDTDVPLGWENPKTGKKEGGSFLLYHIADHKNLDGTPACILEIEFIDNPKVDAALTKSGKWKKTFPAIAEAIADGILEWHAGDKFEVN